MFGLGGFKLLFTLAVIAVVWFGFKYIGRLAEVKAEKAAGRDGIPVRPRRKTSRSIPEAPDIETEDLEQCSDCGAYVPKNQRACGRPKCPYR